MASLNPLIVTFNCGRELVKPDVFARHLVDALQVPNPELIVLSLQEIAPIAYSFLSGSFLTSYFDRFVKAINIASQSWDQGYLNIVTRNVGMTAIIVFARADLVEQVRWIEEGGTGVGWYNTGNKGCVGIRLGYGVDSTNTTELTFLATHLAPMENNVERRNQDWRDIVQGLVFTPAEGQLGIGKHGEQAPSSRGNNTGAQSGGIYSTASYIFVAGDLNYRTSDKKPSDDDVKLFPKPGDQGESFHYSTLLRNDQLSTELEAARTIQGLKEFPIDFPPTYKYSDEARHAVQKLEERGEHVSSEALDHEFGWASHRWPSWCDRILYLPPRTQSTAKSIKPNFYSALPLMSTSDHRAVALSVSLSLKPLPHDGTSSHAEKSPCNIDPSWRDKRAAARRREIVVGLASYLALTWEGNTIVLATIIGAASGWAIIQSILIS